MLDNYASPGLRRKFLKLGADGVRCDKSHEIYALILNCGRLTVGKTGRGVRPSALLNQTVFQRVIGQVTVGFEFHFFPYPSAIGADGFHTE